MIEKLISLDIPPGIVKNGTMYERAGRWADGNLVRFAEGGPRALPGATALSFDVAPPGGTPCGAFGYTITTQPQIIVGTSSKVYRINMSFTYPSSPHEVEDLTAAFPVGAFPSTWWRFDRLLDKVIAVNSVGKVFSIDTAGVVTDITPSGSYIYTGVVVTDEQFVLLLRYGLNGVGVQWASQGTLTFTPSSTNTAGSLDVRTGAPLLTGHVVNGKTLLISGEGLWEMEYVGGPLVYGIRQVAGGCGVVGPRAATVLGNELVWMGYRGMYRFNGYAQPMPCDLSDEIFDSLAAGQGHTHFSVAVGEHEIWWFWTPTGQTSPTKLAIWDRKSGVWSRGDLARASGVGTGAWPQSGVYPNAIGQRMVPVLFDPNGTTVYEHEQIGSVLSGAYLESGPLLLDPAGNDLVRAQKWVPDNNQTSVIEDLTLYRGTWPKVAEGTAGYQIPTAGGELDIRETVRYLRFKQSLKQTDSRIGRPRVGVLKDAKR